MVIPDKFIEHGSQNEQYEEAGLQSHQIATTVLRLVGKVPAEPREDIVIIMELRRFTQPNKPTNTTTVSNSEIAKWNILDRPLTRSRDELALSTFSFLFAEAVQYLQTRVQQVSELEDKLNQLGYRVGQRALELLYFR